jgi:cytoplasmic iron level regulating protein YaaA (DUF328/UPF0246 family)
MLALISPAKKLDFNHLDRPLRHSTAVFDKDTRSLVRTARNLSRRKLQQLMNLSDGLSDLNHARYKAFADEATPDNAKQAALAFAGDTYIGLQAASLDDGDLAYAQDHLRILSGLYGLLRPLDLIQPYRLEMGRRLATRRGGDLYDFWGDKLAKAIDAQVADHEAPVVVNLASNEYFKAARPKKLKARVITPVFKEVKDGKAMTIGTFAKQARGAMARFMIKNRIETPEGLQAFKEGGYKYQAKLSSADDWVFTRKR